MRCFCSAAAPNSDHWKASIVAKQFSNHGGRAMPTQTFEQFISGKSFAIPAYQRDYAWTYHNIDDLFDDITESIDSKSTHYLGTFILSRARPDGRYSVVDGQQRLTTVTMLANALVAKLPSAEGRRSYFEYLFLKTLDGEPKLFLLGANQSIFVNILRQDNSACSATSRSQRRLVDGYQYVQQRINGLMTEGGTNAILTWLDSIRSLEVLEFTEPARAKQYGCFSPLMTGGSCSQTWIKPRAC
jgi:hypothetical protein